MVKVANKSSIGFTIWVFLLTVNTLAAQDLLNTPISISLNDQNVVVALDEISNAGNFSFVYNSDIVDTNQRVSLSLENKSVKQVLNNFLGNDYEYIVRGKYIILQPAKPMEKISFQLKGELTDVTTGQKITEATVLEIGKLSTSISNNKGEYDLSVDTKSEITTLLVSKENYQDTIIQIRDIPSRTIDIQLRPIVQSEITPSVSTTVESKKLVKFLVSDKNRKNTKNVKFLENKKAQISFLPIIGTNRQMGGSISNNVSLNILAGYSYGVNGFEIGGLANIVKKEVNGLQLAGLGNIVGGDTRGTQIAGLVNTNMGKVKGVHIAGFANYAADSVHGVQASGFFNIAKTNRVFQGAGFFNVVYHNSSGWQLAGFFNSAKSNERAFQGAGFVNLTMQEMEGVQAAGFVNRSKVLKGTQLAGFVNTTGEMKGAQVAGFVNTANDVNGVQIAGFVNAAKNIKGVQIGILNIADTVERGATIGLINFVKKGFIHLELTSNDIMPVGVSFKSGTHKFYSIINAGFRPQSELWSYGVGIG